ncbi:Galactose/methyl galactoside import ATP-binding protein MglA [compost metagenome]
MLAQARHALALLGVDIDPQQWVRDLSPAQQQLVEIARACQGDPKVVILDEPTSSLANAEADLVAAAVMRLSAAGIAVVYVSHRMNEIRRLASSCTIMRDGRVAGDVALDNTSTQQIVDLMLGHQDHHTQTVTAPKGGDKVFEVKQLSLPPKLHQVSFELRRGEVLGIAGLLGAGRSELLKAIVGLTPFVEGELILDGETLICPNYAQMLQRGMAYTPENRKAEGIMPLLGVDENTVMTDSRSVSRFGVLNWQKIKQATSAIVSRMRVKTAETGTPIMTLSGGNQQKVVIGRWVYARSRILLLDEPTRGVDVEAKNQIYRIARELAAEGKSIIFVSSEVEELPQVCDRILLLQQGTIVKEFISPVDVEQLMSEVLMIQ